MYRVTGSERPMIIPWTRPVSVAASQQALARPDIYPLIIDQRIHCRIENQNVQTR